jgi:hypothetical protein
MFEAFIDACCSWATEAMVGVAHLPIHDEDLSSFNRMVERTWGGERTRGGTRGTIFWNGKYNITIREEATITLHGSLEVSSFRQMPSTLLLVVLELFHHPTHQTFYGLGSTGLCSIGGNFSRL